MSDAEEQDQLSGLCEHGNMPNTCPICKESKESEARLALVDQLKTGKLKKARETAAELGLSDKEFEVAFVSNASVMDVGEMLEEIGEERAAELVASPEIQSEGPRLVMRELTASRFDGALQMVEALRLSEEVLLSEELQTAATAAALEAVRNGSHKSMTRLMTAFHLPKTFLASAEVAEAAQEGRKNLLAKKSRPEELAANFVAAFAADGVTIEIE